MHRLYRFRRPPQRLAQGESTLLGVMRFVVPELGDRLDPRCNFVGARKGEGSGRQPFGQWQDNPCLAEHLGCTASVRTDDGDSVCHRLHRDQRLALAAQRGHQADPCHAPEMAWVGRVGHEADISMNAEVDSALNQRPFRAAPSTTSIGMSGRCRPNSSAMRANAYTPFS